MEKTTNEDLDNRLVKLMDYVENFYEELKEQQDKEESLKDAFEELVAGEMEEIKKSLAEIKEELREIKGRNK